MREPGPCTTASQATAVDRQETRKRLLLDAVRMAMQTMLCSPGFVFIQEPQVGTSEHAITVSELFQTK
jgi:hypothetical protein